nr:helix-turn-helix transcriptional regulator [Conexibacter arvalis]
MSPRDRGCSGRRPARGRALGLGGAVRVLRARHGFSQESFGFAAGLHRNYVGAVERGEVSPTLPTLQRIADGFSIPASELLALAERLTKEAEE